MPNNSTKQNQASNFLADEIICLFLPYLNVQMLAAMSSACWQLNRLTNDQIVWRNLLNKYFPDKKKLLLDAMPKQEFITNYKKHFSILKGDDKKFFIAILQADQLRVVALLNKNDTNKEMSDFFKQRYLMLQDGEGRSALEWAILLGHDYIAEILVNALSDLSATHLLFAAKYGRAKIYRMLLQKAAIKDEITYRKWFYSSTTSSDLLPTVIAAKNGHLEIFCLTFKMAPVKEKISAVHYAISYGHTAIIQKLPQLDYHLGDYPVEEYIYQIELSSTDIVGNKIVDAQKIESAAIDMLTALLAQGANINVYPANFYNSNVKRYSLLQRSIELGRSNFAKLLIKMGIDINYQSKDGQTPLHFAVRYPNSSLVKILIVNDVNVNLKDDAGHTALALCQQMIEKNIEPLASLREIKEILENYQRNFAKAEVFLATYQIKPANS